MLFQRAIMSLQNDPRQIPLHERTNCQAPWMRMRSNSTPVIYCNPNLEQGSTPLTPIPSPVPRIETSNMTRRQENVPVTAVTAEKLHKEMRDLQVHDLQKSAELKAHGRALSKASRPAMEIYNPRTLQRKYEMNPDFSEMQSQFHDNRLHDINSSEAVTKNGTKVHFVEGNTIKKTPSQYSIPVELKSALKRSKSFTNDEPDAFKDLGFEKDAFPIEYHGLIRRALLDPNSLSCQKLMELVRLICSKAVDNVQYSSPAALLCFSIIEKEHDHMFLESLQNCCREWYNEREKLLRNTPFSSNRASQRWTAFVLFLTELYLLVKNQHGAMLLSLQMVAPHPNSPMAHLAHTLQTLLFDCAGVMVKNCEGEAETLRHMLSIIGKPLETDSSQRMDTLITSLRDVFISPSVTAQVRKTLLEIIELHASKWKLDMSQTVYYFPYTKF